MSETQTEKPTKWICKECGETYTMKVNASNHARTTNHLDFEKEY